MRTVTNDALQYPDYYLQPFHAYDEGNLCWEAAFEVSNYLHATRSILEEIIAVIAELFELMLGSLHCRWRKGTYFLLSDVVSTRHCCRTAQYLTSTDHLVLLIY